MGNGGLGKLVCIYKLIYKIMISSVCKETHWKCPSDDECIYPKICVDGKCIVVGMSHNIQRELKQSVSIVCLLPPVQFLVRVQQR